MKNNINISARTLKYNGIFVLIVDWYENKKCYTFNTLLFDSCAAASITNKSTLFLTYEYVITEVVEVENDFNGTESECITLNFYFMNDGKIDFYMELVLMLPNYIEDVNYYIKKIIRKIKRCTRFYSIKVKKDKFRNSL